MSRENQEEIKIEEMDYYDFMANIDVPVFAIGGLKSTYELMGMAGLDPEGSNKGIKILSVGCGTGGASIFIARRYGCKIVGVDISSEMVRKAMEKAEGSDVEHLLEYRVADAYSLPFGDEEFDIVMTQFVTQFLDRPRAFKEFTRVLKKAGRIAMNEMYKDDDIEPELLEKIKQGEKYFTDAIDLDYVLSTPSEWQDYFKDAGLMEIECRTKCTADRKNIISAKELAEQVGGAWKMLKMIFKPLKYLFKKPISTKLKLMTKGKTIILRKKETAKHVGYILIVGTCK